MEHNSGMPMYPQQNVVFMQSPPQQQFMQMPVNNGQPQPAMGGGLQTLVQIVDAPMMVPTQMSVGSHLQMSVGSQSSPNVSVNHQPFLVMSQNGMPQMMVPVSPHSSMNSQMMMQGMAPMMSHPNMHMPMRTDAPLTAQQPKKNLSNESPSTSQSSVDTRIPCRHFQDGRCNRRKCRFLHVTDTEFAQMSQQEAGQTPIADEQTDAPPISSSPTQ